MDALEKSFASSGETSKLLITLATALIAFCATVINIKINEPTLFSPSSDGQKWLLASSWILLLISTGVGVWTQLAITHVLSEASPTSPPSPWSRRITVPFQIQIFTFLAGVALLTWYGITRLVS